MPILQSDLLNSGQFRTKNQFYSKLRNQPTAFLSHSHKDSTLALGLQALLKEQGWDVYIDWQDQEMPEEPNEVTASNIKNSIVRTDWFLFLATKNSTASRWCPWELGYADGKKNHDRIAIVPTQDNYGHFHGNEYMQLYNHIDVSSSGRRLALFDTHGNGRWVGHL